MAKRIKCPLLTEGLEFTCKRYLVHLTVPNPLTSRLIKLCKYLACVLNGLEEMKKGRGEEN